MMRFRIGINGWQNLAPCLIATALLGCGSVPQSPPSVAQPALLRPAVPIVKPAQAAPALPPAGSGRGGYYQDDGPGDTPPEGLLVIPDAEPKLEPYATRGNRPYVVFGKSYTPIMDNRPLKQRGVGSWYGRKFHGQKTSSGEPYDMYKMSAAHPTLPIPSYARVTNLRNGAQVIVRVNDRGPFHSGRIIDLSYTAALKLGYLGKGSSELEVERILPDEIERIAGAKESRAAFAPPAVAIMTAPAAAPLAADEARIESDQPAPDQLDAILAVFTQPDGSQIDAAIAADAAGAGGAGNGFYLQFGVYGKAGNAESVRAGLLQNWAPSLPPIEVVQTGILYRIFGGPFATRGAAANAAQQVQDGGAFKPLIVQR